MTRLLAWRSSTRRAARCACGARLRGDNRSGVCTPCQRGPVRCALGDGRAAWACGLCRPCFVAVGAGMPVGERLAQVRRGMA